MGGAERKLCAKKVYWHVPFTAFPGAEQGFEKIIYH